jgi:signal transduction histidine kinase
VRIPREGPPRARELKLFPLNHENEILQRWPVAVVFPTIPCMAHAGTDSVQSNGVEAVAEALDRIEQVFVAHPLPGAPDISEPRVSARRRALAMLDSDSRARPQHAHTARLFYTAELLAALAIELAAHRDAAMRLIAELVETAGLRGQALAREVLRTPSLLGFPPAVAIEVQLGLLMAFAPLQDISLWMPDQSGAIHVISRTGEGQASAAAQELARRLLRRKAPTAERGALIGFAVKRWDEPAAALVGRVQRGQHNRCLPMLEEAAPVLGAILEREKLISRNVTAEHTLTQTHERRLMRLGFDVHDGPLQDLALLGEDVRLLRRQLSDVLPRDVRDIMLGRLDDLDAQLGSLDSDLRRISASLQSPFAGHQSLPDAVTDMAHAFAARSGVDPVLEVEGNLENLTDSQQMALLSIAREALNNVREHSDASEVTVSLVGRPMSLELHIADNGSGFDVENTLVQAARDGRFGLVGLHERARMLGGSSHIDSKRGHPTRISVTLPRWRPVAPEGE